MRYKNSVSLIGIVGKDAEVRQTQQGVQYARFSLATSTGGYKKQDGTEVPEKTEWHNIVCWRNLAQMAGQYIKKGMKLDVEGSITYGKYTDQQGIERMSVEILATDLCLMSNPQGQAQRQQAQQPNGGYRQSPPTQQAYQSQPAQNAGGYQQAPAHGGYQAQYSQQTYQDPFPPAQGDELPF